MEQVTETFEAVCQKGDRYIIQLWQRLVRNPNLQGEASILGSKRYALISGEHVNARSNGTFEIVWTDRDEITIVSRV